MCPQTKSTCPPSIAATKRVRRYDLDTAYAKGVPASPHPGKGGGPDCTVHGALDFIIKDAAAATPSSDLMIWLLQHAVVVALGCSRGTLLCRCGLNWQPRGAQTCSRPFELPPAVAKDEPRIPWTPRFPDGQELDRLPDNGAESLSRRAYVMAPSTGSSAVSWRGCGMAFKIAETSGRAPMHRVDPHID